MLCDSSEGVVFMQSVPRSSELFALKDFIRIIPQGRINWVVLKA